MASAFKNVVQKPNVEIKHNRKKVFEANLGCIGSLPNYELEFEDIGLKQIAEMSNIETDVQYMVGRNKKLKW